MKAVGVNVQSRRLYIQKLRIRKEIRYMSFVFLSVVLSVDSFQSYCEIQLLESLQYIELQYFSAFTVNEKHAYSECFQFLQAANWFSYMQAASSSSVVIT